MTLSIPVSAICLVVCHGGPADHFATFYGELVKHGHPVHIAASGPALNKFHERGIKVNTPFSLENLLPEEEDNLANQIAKTCSAAFLVLTDVGHAFDIKIQKALTIHATKIPRWAYYDNPESFVPGEYSLIAPAVIQCAEGILFANETLAKAPIYNGMGREVDFGNRKRIGIGFYPIDKAKEIAKLRELDQVNMRSIFLNKNKIEDKGQKILVYFGGNNEVYFSKAFPAFLLFLSQASEQMDLSDTIIVMQQHPGAKVKNQDGNMLSKWLEEVEGKQRMPKVVLSDFSSDTVQVIADAAFYYQTSMGPQFVLEGIPTFQIGHETYADILVRSDPASSITNATQLTHVIENLKNDASESSQRDLVLKSLGIREDWPNVLQKVILDLQSGNKDAPVLPEDEKIESKVSSL